MTHYFDILEKTIKTFWDKPALCNFNGKEFTHAQLAEQMAKFGILFEACGMKKDTKVALCAKNTAQWAVSFLSVNTYGSVVVPILADFTPESINHLVDHSDSVLLFTDKDIWENLDTAKMPKLKAAINIEDFSLLYCTEDRLVKLYNDMESAFKAKYPEGVTKENFSIKYGDIDDIAVINYTSGTTSAPKGVMLTYHNIIASVDYALRNVPIQAGEDKLVSMLPMAHIYGLVFEFIYPLTGGATVYYLGKTPAPSYLLKAMKTVRPYAIITVPLVMEKIYKSSVKPVLSKPAVKALCAIPGLNKLIYGKVRNALDTAFGGNIRHYIMGGAALNPEVEKCFRKIGLKYCVGYGMTEAAPLLAYEDWRRYAPASCGKKVDCALVRIDSSDPEHIVGEIQAKGENVFKGYYKNEEATKAAFTEDGYLKTGDLGIIDREGNIFIKGRSKNMILSANGQNIYPEEMEAAFNSQPYVVESICVDRGGRIVALAYFDKDAIAKDGADLAAVMEQARTATNKVLPGYSQIASVEPQDKPFEKTPKMSIRRFLYK